MTAPKPKKLAVEFLANVILGTLGLTSLGYMETKYWAIAYSVLGASLLGLFKVNQGTRVKTWGWKSMANDSWSLVASLDPGQQDFVFRGMGIPASVPESRMLDFLGTAKHRQTKARYGGWGTVKEKDILSKRHFTKKVSPPFFGAEYDAILKVLDKTELLTKRDQGHSGYLMGIEFVSDNQYLEIVVTRWSTLHQHKSTSINLVKPGQVARIFKKGGRLPQKGER